MEIGDTLFVRTEDPSKFAVGTVTEFDTDTVFVSIPVPRVRRREPSIPITRSDYLTGDEIENFPGENLIFKTGHRLLCSVEIGVVQAVEVSSDVTGPSPSFEGRIVSFDGTSWTAVSDGRFPTEQTLPAPILGQIQKQRCLQPVDPYFDVIATDIGDDRTFEADAVFERRGVSVPIRVELKLRGHLVAISGTTHQTIVHLLSGLRSQSIVNWTLKSTGESSPSWLARYVSIQGLNSRWDVSSGSSAIVRLSTPLLTMTYKRGAVAFTREVFQGLRLDVFTHRILQREPPATPSWMPLANDSIRMPIFDRPGLIYVPPRPDCVEKENYLAVLYHGEPLEERRRLALTAWIGYITGGRCAHVLTETFDTRDRLTATYTDRGPATTQKSAPIPTDRPSSFPNLIVREFPTLLAQFSDLYRNPAIARQTDAVLHHYAEGVDSSYPTTRILRLAIALEALVGLVTKDNDSSEEIVSRDAFRGVKSALYKALESLVARGRLDRAAATRFQRKVSDSNRASNTKRIRKFWKDVGVRPTERQGELLRRLRNESVHRGFVGDESTSRGMLRNHRDANTLIDLFNRAMLAYMRYHGPVRLTSRPSWVQARSGRTFQTPGPDPNRPKLELRIETTLEPMSVEESKGAKCLAALAKKSK